MADGSILAAGLTLGGGIMVTGATIYIAAMGRRNALTDSKRGQNQDNFEAFLTAEEKFRTEQSVIIQSLQKQVSSNTDTIHQLQRDNVELERKINHWEARYTVLESLVTHIGARIEDMIRSGLDDIGKVKEDLRAIVADIGAVNKHAK